MLNPCPKPRPNFSSKSTILVTKIHPSAITICNMPPSQAKNGLFQAHKRLRVTNSVSNAVWVSSNGKNREPADEVPEPEKTDTPLSSPFSREDNGNQGLKEGAAAKMQLSPQQVMRMELNKLIARAKRIHKICEERVAEAKAKGIPLPNLEDLLVDETWLDALPNEFQKPYMQKLSEFITQESKGSTPIYPSPALVFNALNICPFEKVKVVIIGQDPYHGPGQAMGLCFSVPNGIKMPSSLVNIFKEIQQDVGCSLPSHGNLERWAVQGVLLLNTVLTVRAHQANSHAKRGWEVFTDAVIRAISLKRSEVIFILWGNSAQEKIRIIDTNKHRILKAAHPSGLSAHKGFFQCRHFSQANKILEQSGLTPIDWQI